MAMRRSGARDGEREYDSEPEELGFAGISDSGGDRFGNGRDRPDAFYNLSPEEQQSIIDLQGGAIAGNTEPGKPFATAPTTFGPRQEPTPTPTQSMPSAPAFNLPQGVSVDEGMFSGVQSGGNAMATPAMPAEPNPLAMGTQNPIQNPAESGTSRGPMRRSQQSPSLFAQSRSPMLSGRAGGLLGGGLGSTGAGEPSGPLQPTQMFQKLLELFRQG